MEIKPGPKVVVTGIGIISSIGENKEQFFQNCYRGIIGLKKVTLFETSNFSTEHAGEVADSDIPYEVANPADKDRTEHFVEKCVEEMLKDSGLNRNYISSLGNKAYLSFATSLGTNSKVLQYSKERVKGVTNGDWLLQIAKFLPRIKHITGIQGGSYTTTTACAASTTAIGIGFELIRSGQAELVVVGGADPLSEFSYYGFNSLRALSKSKCKPFDQERDGINIGEGCGFLILESLGHAQKRTAHVYAEIMGYGINNEAYHITSPDPKGRAAYLSMQMASMESDDDEVFEAIDYINAHGTGTKLNDSMELTAIKELFQNRSEPVLVSSIKSQIGHCLAAAGIIELILTILSIKNGICIGNSNLNIEMNEGDSPNISLIKKNCKKQICLALTNNFAFAGNTASILVSAYNQ